MCDVLTERRSFSSGPRLSSSFLQEPFVPQLSEYEMGLSSGQSSSLGKPIPLKKKQTGEAENWAENSCVCQFSYNNKSIFIMFYTCNKDISECILSFCCLYSDIMISHNCHYYFYF